MPLPQRSTGEMEGREWLRGGKGGGDKAEVE